MVQHLEITQGGFVIFIGELNSLNIVNGATDMIQNPHVTSTHEIPSFEVTVHYVCRLEDETVVDDSRSRRLAGAADVNNVQRNCEQRVKKLRQWVLLFQSEAMQMQICV